MHLCRTLWIPRSRPRCPVSGRCFPTNDLLSLTWLAGGFIERKMLIKGPRSSAAALLSCHFIKQIPDNVIATRFYISANELVNLFGKWMGFNLACWINSVFSFFSRRCSDDDDKFLRAPAGIPKQFISQADCRRRTSDCAMSGCYDHIWVLVSSLVQWDSNT